MYETNGMENMDECVCLYRGGQCMLWYWYVSGVHGAEMWYENMTRTRGVDVSCMKGWHGAGQCSTLKVRELRYMLGMMMTSGSKGRPCMKKVSDNMNEAR